MLLPRLSCRRWRYTRTRGMKFLCLLILLGLHTLFKSVDLENLLDAPRTIQEKDEEHRDLSWKEEEDEGLEAEGLDESNEKNHKEMKHEPEALLDDNELNKKNDAENQIESNNREQQNNDFDHSVTSYQECRLNLQHYIAQRMPQWLDDNVPIPLNSFDRQYNDITSGMYEVQFSVKHITAELYETEWHCSNQNASAPVRKAVPSLIVQCPVESSLEHISIHAPKSTTPMNATTYDMRPFLKCDELFLKERPSKEIKMAACVETFLSTADTVAQWVEYHKMVGVDHFWIYVHDTWNTSTLLQRPYITYVPFQYETHPFARHWKKRLKVGMGNFQGDHDFECMARARQSNVEWLLMIDVDEFVHVPTVNDTTKANTQAPILKDYLTSQGDKVAAIEMNSIPFGRNNALKHPHSPANETLVLDYIWRRNQPIETVIRGRWKNIVRPALVDSVDVHYVHGIQKGYHQKKAKANEIRMDHFRHPDDGVFQTNNPKALVADSSLRDIYGARLRDALKDFKVFAKDTVIPTSVEVV